MSNIVRPTELTNAVRTLLGYVDDLRRAPALHDGSTKLRLIVNYCQKDPVVRALSEQLRGRVSTEALHERTSGDALRPPEDPRDRLAFWHTLLYHLKQGFKLELRELVTRAFPGSGVEDRWRAFLEQVVGGYAAGLEQVLARIEARDAADTVDAEAVFREALAGIAGPATSAPSARKSTSTPPAEPDLLAAIDRSGLPEDELCDLRVDAKLLAIELRKARPSPARLAELERSFLAATPALGAAFRGALGGQTAYAPGHGGASVREADAQRAEEEHGGEEEEPPAARRSPTKKKAPAASSVGAQPAAPSRKAKKKAPAASSVGAQPAAPSRKAKEKKAPAARNAGAQPAAPPGKKGPAAKDVGTPSKKTKATKKKTTRSEKKKNAPARKASATRASSKKKPRR